MAISGHFVTCLLIYFAVRGSLLSARLGVPGSAALLPAPVDGSGRRGTLSPTAGTGMLSVCPACRDRGGRLQFFTLHQRLVLAFMELQHRGLTEFSQSPQPGDSGLCHSHLEQGSAGDSCSPGGRARSGRLSCCFRVLLLGIEPPLSFLSLG